MPLNSPTSLTPLGITIATTIAALLLLAFLLHQLKRLGTTGLALRESLSAGFGLDVVVTAYTVLPFVVAPIYWAFATPPSPTPFSNPPLHWAWHIPAAILGQLLAIYIWCFFHELANRDIIRNAKGQRLINTINKNLSTPQRKGQRPHSSDAAHAPSLTARILGTLRNHFALLWMLLAVPVFNAVRLAEYIVYPVLVLVVRLPRYDQRQWINVSRHKFEGLVGHDLIWCLYCDWMTGVWSLGTEMLRNIESFWCPIRFSNPHKCSTCALDFPDTNTTWTPDTANIQAAAALHAANYPDQNGDNSWLGHPARKPLPPSHVTINGKPQ